MISKIVASAALFAAAALAGSVGSAVIVNNCNYDVHLSSVPASGGGQVESNQVLHTGATWSQVWTPLTNTMGWSIKLSKTAVLHNIMQYEYTYHGDNTIWYDLSEVDGNPWSGNFMITAQSANGQCQPRQAAYRYSSDDAYGMQDCTADAVITVTLCSAENGALPDTGASASASQTVKQLATPTTSSTPVAVVKASSSSSSSSSPSPVAASSHPVQFAAANFVQTTFSSSYVAPTTTHAETTTHTPMVVEIPTDKLFTTYQTVTQTDYVTVDLTVTAYATAAPHKRHEHHHNRHAGRR